MKTIILDIETAPSLGYIWGFWQQNIGDDMVLDYGGYIMSCSIKTLGEEHVTYLENRTKNDKKIVKKILKHLDGADFVIAHNGIKFDIPFIKARASIHGLNPPSPFKAIDTLKIARKEMNFKRNSLDFLAKALDVESRKLTNRKFPGFKLWWSCLHQDDEAWKEMKQYNILDVEVLEQVYLRLRPWASNHPNINVGNDVTVLSCPKCGSIELNKRGYYTTNKGKYQRYACDCCGGWSSETTAKNTTEERRLLLASR